MEEKLIPRRESSSKFAKPSSFSSRQNNRVMEKKNSCNLKQITTSHDESLSIRSRVRQMGPICRARRKTGSSIFGKEEEEEEEENGFSKKLWDELWADDEKSLWLSSGTETPSSCLDDSRSFFSTLLDLSLDEFLVPLLSISSSSPGLFFDGSRINPVEEACLALQRASSSKIFLENLKEDEIVSWLQTSLEPCEDSASYLNSYLDSFPFSSSSSSSSSSSWVLNSERISDAQSESYYSVSDFSSPSCKSSWSSAQSLNSSISSFNEESTENFSGIDLENVNAEEPLFWPSYQKFDWKSGITWDFFIMSPRKMKFDRSISFTGSKTRKEVQKLMTMPSRLRRSSKNLMKIVPLNMSNDLLETTDATSLLGEDLPIEELLGLNQFDGHEGVELEFNKDNFSFDESL